jgi:hypothetical protein
MNGGRWSQWNGYVDMNQKYFGNTAANLDTEKNNLLQLLHEVRALSNEFVWVPHPMFGKLNRSQWGRFMYVHIDHHLRQFSN